MIFLLDLNGEIDGGESLGKIFKIMDKRHLTKVWALFFFVNYHNGTELPFSEKLKKSFKTNLSKNIFLVILIAVIGDKSRFCTCPLAEY